MQHRSIVIIPTQAVSPSWLRLRQARQRGREVRRGGKDVAHTLACAGGMRFEQAQAKACAPLGSDFAWLGNEILKPVVAP